MFLLAMLIVVQPSLAACPADAAVLRADVAAATQAYDDWAWNDFDRSVAAVSADLGCLTEVVPGPEAQATHRLFALAWSGEKDEARNLTACRAVLGLEPSYEPDPVVAPQGSLLRRAWEPVRATGAAAPRRLPAGLWQLSAAEVSE